MCNRADRTPSAPEPITGSITPVNWSALRCAPAGRRVETERCAVALSLFDLAEAPGRAGALPQNSETAPSAAVWVSLLCFLTGLTPDLYGIDVIDFVSISCNTEERHWATIGLKGTSDNFVVLWKFRSFDEWRRIRKSSVSYRNVRNFAILGWKRIKPSSTYCEEI